MKKIITYIQIFAFALALVFPISAFADSAYDWYDSGSYYDNSWSDSGSYYDNSWYDSGSYYDNSWYDSGSYYSNDWYDSGSYYDNSWYDSGSYYDNSWYDSGSYYSNDWYDSGSYYDNSWYDSGSYYDNSWYDSGSYYSNDWYDSGSYYDNSWYDSGSYYDNTVDYGCSDCGINYVNNADDYYGYYSDYTYDYGYGCGDDCYDYGYDDCYDDCYDDDYDYCDDHDCNEYDDLDVVCSVSDRTIEKGDSVTFTADADGGRGSYTYRWSGDVSGSNRSITERFSREGTYRATVRVTDRDGRTATANCATVVVEDKDDEDFDAVCKVSDSSIEEGDTVRFTAEVDGGDSPYDYDWSGDVNEDERTFTKRFNKSGTYEVDLKVTDDDGRIARDTCTVRVKKDNDDDDDRDIVVTSGTLSSGRGNLAGVSSVYLNQVPYTGPEDVAKGIAFAVGILAWSIAGALIIRNKINKKMVSNRIEAFKEANRTTRA